MIEKFTIFLLIHVSLIACLSQNIQEINNICNKIGRKHSSTEETVKEFLLNNNYDYEKEKNKIRNDRLYEFLIGKKMEEKYEIEYFPIIKKYLINKYIIPILILWIIFLIFFLSKKFLFKSDLKINILLKFSTSIIIVIFILIFIESICIIWKTKKLNSSINDASCNLLKFFYELNHGRIKESNSNSKKNDKWPGLYALNSILLDTSEQIIKISNKKNDTFEYLGEIKYNIEEYEKLMNSIIEQSSKGLPSPNNEIDQEIMPIYLYELNNINLKNSLINLINSEYLKYFFETSNQIELIHNYSNSLSYKSQAYDNQLNNIFDNISDHCYYIKDKSLNITNNIIIIERHSEFILIFIKIVNIISICFSIFIIFLVIIYHYHNLFWIKISFHISWNLAFVLTILFICVWYFIINLGEGFEKSIILLEEEVLKTNNNEFFNSCLNTLDSDLNIIFNIYNYDSALIEIDKYYKNIFPILSHLTAMEEKLPRLMPIKIAIKETNKYLNNYELTTNSSYQVNDIEYILNEISNLTNNFKEGKSKGFCDSNDIWVSSKKNCGEYKYITRYEIKNEFDRNINEQYCFIIQDNFKEIDLQKIYRKVCSNEAYSQIVNKISGLTTYYNNNENLLESLEKKLKELERYNKKISEQIKLQIKQCENDIGDLIDIYTPTVGNINITDLFKCGRLKRKIINYYDISLNQIHYNCKSIKNYLIMIILLIIIGIIFIIINSYRDSKEVKSRRYLKIQQHKDVNNDGVELIEEVPGEDEDN